jgi:hypothetical protein
VLLLQSIPIFVALLADLWWALCVFLALLVVWAMSDEGATSPYAGPVLRGRKPTNRSPLWSGITKSPRTGKSGASTGSPAVPVPPRASAGVRLGGVPAPGVADWALEPRPLPKSRRAQGRELTRHANGSRHFIVTANPQNKTQEDLMGFLNRLLAERPVTRTQTVPSRSIRGPRDVFFGGRPSAGG